MQDLMYPIGKPVRPEVYNLNEVVNGIKNINDLPHLLNKICASITSKELETPYRPGGWTAAQVIHHLYDSHSNAYIRFKLGLTEDNPIIKPYDEASWAEMADAKSVIVQHSVSLIEHLHARWTIMLKEMTELQWQHTIYHPEQKREMTLFQLLSIYSWHGAHHLEHIKLSIKAAQ